MDKETTNSIQENIRLVRQAFETINAVDLSNVNKPTSPCYVNLASQGFSYSYRSKIRSPDASIDAVQSLRGTFAGLHYDVQEIIVQMQVANIQEPFLLFLQLDEAHPTMQSMYIELKMVREQNTKQFVMTLAL